MADRTLSTTSFAILGYLAVQPWSAYELAKQMGRTLHHFWARAESGIYRELKRLDDAGLAAAQDEQVGQRSRTRYTITSRGRQELRGWLAEPRSDGLLESEGLVRVLLSDSGTKDDLFGAMQAMRHDAQRRGDQMRTLAKDYLVTGGQFPHRSHINILVARFLIDFETMVEDWCTWAEGVVDTWPDTKAKPPTVETMALFRETLDR